MKARYLSVAFDSIIYSPITDANRFNHDNVCYLYHLSVTKKKKKIIRKTTCSKFKICILSYTKILLGSLLEKNKTTYKKKRIKPTTRSFYLLFETNTEYCSIVVTKHIYDIFISGR